MGKDGVKQAGIAASRKDLLDTVHAGSDVFVHAKTRRSMDGFLKFSTLYSEKTYKVLKPYRYKHESQ